MKPTPLLLSSALRAALAAAGLAVLPVHAAAPAGAAGPQTTTLGTVEVTARGSGDAAIPAITTTGSFGTATVQDTPAAITIITRSELDDRQPQTLSEVARGDAALGDNYAPVGYYQDIAIRGFPLDLATGYRQDGMSIAGEQPVALEGVERVEILKGLAGIAAGAVAPGGIVNYVSKRPADVQTATMGTDSHGSRRTALDLGHWFSDHFGLRVNAAHEAMHSYVQHADGQRNFLAVAADWLPTPDFSLQLDADYKASRQRSVSGYQLLGGTALPPHPSRTRMLGFEPWQEPVGIDAANASLRLGYRITERWGAHLAVSHSRSVIDDNVAFAYGCFYSPACADGSPGYFFAPDGDYDIYDFRSPDDDRRNNELRAWMSGQVDTGPLAHALTFGLDVFQRELHQRPYVYDYVGTANIDDVEPPYFPPSPNQPGPSTRTLDSWQHSAYVLDRIRVAPHWQVLAGGRLLRLHERAWDTDGTPIRDTRLHRALPQAALLWEPSKAWTAYASWSEGVELGGEAPYWTSNGGATLPPLVARQAEVGVKFAWNDAFSVQAAAYRIRQPFQFARPDATAEGFTFVQSGAEVHRGVELNAAGRVGQDLRVTASVNWIEARAQDTGVPAYEGHQLVNVPPLRATVRADYRLPFAPALSVSGGWRHAARNVATPDGRTRVPAYDVWDAGLRYAGSFGAHAAIWQLSVDNLFNHFYWRDTGSAGGDRYLFPGAPRLLRLSLTVDL